MDPSPHRHERWVACAPTAAFRRWVAMGAWWPPAHSTDPAALADVRIGPGPGAPWLLVYGDRSEGVGEVTAWEPGRLLAHTSTLAQPDPPASEVTVRFSASGGATRVAFAHGGWTAANAASRARFGDWPLILDAYVAAAGGAPGC